jgi:hypothetical protein
VVIGQSNLFSEMGQFDMTNLNGVSATAPPPPLSSITPAAVAQARAAGYSDQEIVDHLAPKAPDQFSAALKAGYSPTEILQHLAPEQSGIIDNARQGAAEALQGVGSTIKTYAGDGYGGDTLKKAGDYIAPSNFVPSPLVDSSGVHPSNILRSLARATPGAAAALLAAGGATLAAPEAAIAAPIIGATAAGVAMSAGDAAKQAAVNRTGDPNAVPNAADKVRGAATSTAESAVQSLPISRFLGPGRGAIAGNVIANTGLKGVGDAVKKAAVSTGEQAGASGASNVVGQVSQSVGTPGGVSVDPTQALNAAATGGVVGGALAGKRALPEALDANKFSAITPDLKPAAVMAANRIAQAADGRNLQGSFVSSNAAQRAGEDSMIKARAGIHSELSDAVSNLTTTLPTDTQNILSAAQNGNMPTPGDYAKLKAAVANDPQGPNVVNLVQQAHAMSIFDSIGDHTNGRFTGGGSGTIGQALTPEHLTKTALIATLGGEAGHLIGFSPEMLAVAAGGTVAARALDNITGQQAPAGRIVRNFADGQTPVRLNVPAPAAAPIARPGPTGPAISPLASPWANPPQRPAAPVVAGGPGTMPMLPPAVVAQMKARAALTQAAANNVRAPAPQPVVSSHGGPPMAGGRGTLPMLPPAVQAQMAARANLAKLAAANAPAAPAAVPVAAEPSINPLALPKSITGPTANIMRGAALAQKLRDTQQPDAPPPPAVDPLALPKNVIGPAATLMRGAALAQKLKEANGTGEAQASTKQPALISVSKADDGSLSINTGSSAYKLPLAPYWNLPVPEAANRIMRDQLAANVPIKNSGAFLSKTIGVLNTLRDKVQAVTQAVPTIPAVEVARFEGIKTQKAAADYRDHLKSEHPQAADALDRVFSNEAIASQWAQKR